MRDWLLLVVVVNPAAVAIALWPRERPAAMGTAAGIAAALGLIAAGASGPLLDLLDVSRSTFQVATAVVVGLAGAKGLLVGPRRVTDEGPPPGRGGRVVIPLLFPVLVTPSLVTASVSVGAERGVVLAAVGLLSGLALAVMAAVAPPRWEVLWRVAARFLSAGAVALALALAVDGVTTI
jgi:small neutral amino acid transporter SnatA (MarC family)